MSEILLHLSAGQGPEECRWVVARLAEAFAAEARAEGLTCEPIEAACPLPASLLLRVAGDGAAGFAAARTGTVRWTGESPLRPRHKRRNWFVGVRIAPAPEAMPALREADIGYETMRASGPGGQHVNRTDSAVRATHRPTGLVTTSQDQRSQHANKRIARLKLAMMLEDLRHADAAGGRRALWERNHAVERGNAVRSYAGSGFVRKG